MNDSLSDFRFACVRCADGHMGDVQKSLLDMTMPRGREPRKANTATCHAFAALSGPQILRGSWPDTDFEPVRKKTIVTSLIAGNNNHFLGGFHTKD
ncbi:MAG TPA: hypothetical protein VMV39_03920 [Terracidiphilus sp.]|nr:hypothetical protein [Terracidiphilus sp.]